MAKATTGEIAIGVTDFKTECPPLIDAVAQGRQGCVVLLKRQKTGAAIVPSTGSAPDLWGALRGTVCVGPGVDLTQGTGEIWAAEK